MLATVGLLILTSAKSHSRCVTQSSFSLTSRKFYRSFEQIKKKHTVKILIFTIKKLLLSNIVNFTESSDKYQEKTDS